MKQRFAVLLLISVLALAACSGEQARTFTLPNQNGEEVTFPGDKPSLFFFITTYT